MAMRQVVLNGSDQSVNVIIVPLAANHYSGVHKDAGTVEKRLQENSMAHYSTIDDTFIAERQRINR